MAINPAATVSTANGIAKRVHGKIVNLIPSKNLKVLKRIKYDKDHEVGGEFEELAWLTAEHGFTYGGSSGAKRTLNSSEVAESQPAKQTPNEIDFRSEAVITLMSRAEKRGDKAFESYVAALMRNARTAFDKRLEIAMLYGGTSLATTSACTDAGTSSVITITTATWAPHIWLNMRNCAIDAYDGATQKNSRADLNITAVNIKNKTLTVVGNADDINDIVAVGSTGVGVELYFKGAKGLDGTGLRAIANLTTGTYLDISATDYPDVWNGTQVVWDRATTEFSWQVLNDGLEEMASRGAEGDMIAQVPFPVWNQLNNSLDALRVFDSSYSVNKTDVGRGIDSITYHAVTGTVTIECSGFQRYGEVLVYADATEDQGRARRIGSSEVTFNYPGRGEEMFKLGENSNTAEYRAFSDQMLWLPAPRNCGVFKAA